jgi:hypothetical protein
MKGDFAKAYNAGKQAYREHQSRPWEHPGPWDLVVFTCGISAITLLSFADHWLHWPISILLYISAMLGYIKIRTILQRRNAQPPKEQ